MQYTKEFLTECTKRAEWLRLERELSRGEVAEMLGKSSQWLYAINRGEFSMRLEDLNLYAEILNSSLDSDPPLPYVYEDEKIVVRLVRPEDYTAREAVIHEESGKRSMRYSLSDRDKGYKLDGEDEIARNNAGGEKHRYQGRYYLIPYITEIDGELLKTPPHTHPPSVEAGVALKSRSVLNVGMNNSGRLTEQGSFIPHELSEGDSYSIATAVPHWLSNNKEEKAKLLVVRLEIVPFDIVKHDQRRMVSHARDFPQRQMLAEVHTRGIRIFGAQLGPYEKVEGHRHTFSEQLIVVTKGVLKLVMQLPKSGKGYAPPAQSREFELEPYCAAHFDARIRHFVANPTNQEARYIVVYRYDLNDSSETHVRVIENT